MANEKKPSIYSDRGTIGSSEELDEYGVWVKSEPQDLSLAGLEPRKTPAVSTEIPKDASGTDDLDIPDIEDLPEFDSPEEEESEEVPAEDSTDSFAEDDFELPDIDTDEESGENLSLELSTDDSFEEVPLVNASAEQEDEGFTEVSMDDFIETLDSEPAEKEPIVEQSFMETPQQSPTEPSNDLSTQLLMKIADELSSIRTELSSLKKELANVKAVTAMPEAGKNDFFGEEDDEKIALTGDELNNILNTADFTEEAGADVTMELSEKIVEPAAEDKIDFEPINLDMDMDISLEDTNPDELDKPEHSGESKTDDIDLSIDDVILTDESLVDESLIDESLPDFAIEETEELKQIRESGAEPMTPAPAPEDTEYLTDDTLTSEEPIISEETIDLTGAIIEEPDLSSDIQDNPLEEPSLEDISIDLDLSETALEDGAEELENEAAEEEMELSMDIPDEDSMLEEVPLAPEIESDEDGGDPSLIPEAFVTEAEELDSVELDAEELEPAELYSEDSQTPEKREDEIISVDDIDTFVTGTEDDDTLEEIGENDELQLDEGASLSAAPALSGKSADPIDIPSNLKKELKTVLSYMDQLLESLPDDKIEEFAQSEYYDTYKKLFKELGLV